MVPGVTISGSATIDRNDGRRFMAVCTNVTGSSEAVTIYDFGSLDADASPGGEPASTPRGCCLTVAPR